MRRTFVIGVVMFAAGMVDAAFWIRTELEYQELPKPLPAAMGIAELARDYPRVALACRFFRHDLFPPGQPPPKRSPLRLLGHKITGQALLGMTLVFTGWGVTLWEFKGRFWALGRLLAFALAAFLGFAYLFIHPLLLFATY